MYLHIDSKSLLHHCRAASRDWLVPELCRVLRICCLLPFQLFNSLVRSTKLCTLQGKLNIMKHQHQHFPTVADVQENYGKLFPNFPKIISTRFDRWFWIFFSLMQKATVFLKGHLLCNHGRGIGRSSFSDFGHFQSIGQICFQFTDLSLTTEATVYKGVLRGKKLTYADKKWRKIRKINGNTTMNIRKNMEKQNIIVVQPHLKLAAEAVSAAVGVLVPSSILKGHGRLRVSQSTSSEWRYSLCERKPTCIHKNTQKHNFSPPGVVFLTEK